MYSQTKMNLLTIIYKSMTFNDIGQKVKGEAQKVKGTIEEHTGHPVKGAVDKAKGTINSSIADAKMHADKEVAEDNQTY